MTVSPSRSSRSSSRPLLLAGAGGCVVLALCLCVIAAAVGGFLYYRQTQTTAAEPAVEYILDASPRMDLPTEGGTRLSVARGVLAEIIRPAEPSVAAGLRVFGTGANTDACQDTRLVVPLARANQALIADDLSALAVGRAADAALAQAMIEAIRDLSSKRGPHSLVVVTGGTDSCNPEAGQLIAQEAERAGIKLQMFVVGFQVPETDAQAIKGMVDQTEGGQYIDTQDERSLRSTLQRIQNQIDRPVSQTGAYASQTACDHPYFPMRTGATWTYESPDMPMTWTVTSVTGDLSNATTTMTIDAGQGMTLNLEWTCTPDGIVSYQFGNISSAQMGNVGEWKVISHSGTFLLPADQFVPGASWNNNYTIDITMAAGGQNITLTAEVADVFKAGDVESVGVGAGTFDAIRVDSTGTTTSTTSFGPATTTNVTSTYWYAKGVGLVKFSSTAGDSTNTYELVSYSVP